MFDILRGALGSGRTVLVGWVLPFTLGSIGFVVLVLPALREESIGRVVLDLVETRQGLAFLGAALAGGLVMNALQTPLYRILEGHLLWPERLVELRRERHLERRRRLRAAADTRHGIQRALAREKPRRYPASPAEFAPTMLGNAIRRFETYAFDRYRIDSHLLWHELRAVAPRAATSQEDGARSAVDFFVCLLYTLGMLAVASLASLIVGGAPIVSLLVLIGSAVGGIGAYAGAVQATDRWAASVRAVVNLGRLPLATHLGLMLPDDLETERQMWRRVNWLVRVDFDSRIEEELNPFRLTRVQGS